MLMSRLGSFCGSPAHPLDRRGFLGTLAAGAAAFAADMTGLNALTAPALARELGRADSTVPDYVSFYTQTEGRDFGGSGFLGARYAPMELSRGTRPDNMSLPAGLSDLDHKERADLRDLLSQQFERGRAT